MEIIQEILVAAIIIAAAGYLLYRLSAKSGTPIGCHGCSRCKDPDSCAVPEEDRAGCADEKKESSS